MKASRLKRVLEALEQIELDVDVNVTLRLAEIPEGLSDLTVFIPIADISLEHDMIEIQVEAKDAKELSL